jgi:hypothetical protein
MLMKKEIDTVLEFLTQPYVVSDADLPKDELSLEKFRATKPLSFKNEKYTHSSMALKVTINETTIYRPVHDIVHTLRVVLYVKLLYDFLNEIHCPIIKGLDLLTLERMALFSVVGRLNEIGWDDHLFTYKYFRWRSAEIFKAHCSNIYDPKMLERLHKCLYDMGSPSNLDPYHIVLNMAHKLDLYRVDPLNYETKCLNYIVNHVGNQYRAAIHKLSQSVRYIIWSTSFKQNPETFLQISSEPWIYYQSFRCKGIFIQGLTTKNRTLPISDRKKSLLRDLSFLLSHTFRVETVIKWLEQIKNAQKNQNSHYHFIWKEDISDVYTSLDRKDSTGNYLQDKIKWHILGLLKSIPNCFRRALPQLSSMQSIFDKDRDSDAIQWFDSAKNFTYETQNPRACSTVQGPMYIKLESHVEEYMNKHLITSDTIVYRCDSRKPDEIIAADGFHPRELSFKSLKKHLSGAVENACAGAVSTSTNLKAIFFMGENFNRNYLYRIKLLSGQATKIYNEINRYPLDEMLVVGHISLEQIEMFAMGYWYRLDALKSNRYSSTFAIDFLNHCWPEQ